VQKQESLKLVKKTCTDGSFLIGQLPNSKVLILFPTANKKLEAFICHWGMTLEGNRPKDYESKTLLGRYYSDLEQSHFYKGRFEDGSFIDVIKKNDEYQCYLQKESVWNHDPV
jgi:hypothetical protein